jgi:3-deoxy-D-manno-octulosonate 8-phosphate phosphatase (KDO 8-P phosphatase)
MQGVHDKRAALVSMIEETGLAPDQVCAVGDDIVDLPMMGACGMAVAVADACPEAKESADWVTQARGGHGAVREVIEMILRAQAHWQAIVARLRGSD